MKLLAKIMRCGPHGRLAKTFNGNSAESGLRKGGEADMMKWFGLIDRLSRRPTLGKCGAPPDNCC